jgi:hypothetical protein
MGPGMTLADLERQALLESLASLTWPHPMIGVDVPEQRRRTYRFAHGFIWCVCCQRPYFGVSQLTLHFRKKHAGCLEHGARAAGEG